LSFGVEHIKLTSFRNYESLDLRLQPRFTILAGENAQGKTSLLEAVYWLATTRLLRGHRDAEAIKHGSAGCFVQSELISGTTIAASIELGARKKFFLNGASLPRASDVFGRLPIVSISIFDLEIVRGDPSQRRAFLDLELSSLFPAYLRHFAVYKRAVEQRNALLKAAQTQRTDDFQFETWEEQISIHGAAIRESRRDHVVRLSESAEMFHHKLASREEKLSLKYQPKDQSCTPEEIRKLLESGRRNEIMRGSTQIGPHRDDLEILIDNLDARHFGSQGQQRTAVIALKLATLEVGTQNLGSPQVLLLDDMLSDLDPVRRAKLCTVICEQAGQAILTCTEAEAAGKQILEMADILQVSDGKVQRLYTN
jgi:DNA replication and repair protein RecF